MRIVFMAFLATLFSLSSSISASTKESKKVEMQHFEGIVMKWMQKMSRAHGKNMKASREVAHDIITHGGLACWLSVIALTSEIDDTTQFRLRQTQHEEIIRICGGHETVFQYPPEMSSFRSSSQKKRPELFVLNRQHNGLGNQLFQYIFSRLLAEGLGAEWKTSLIRPDLGETPRKETRLPPNSAEGWNAFSKLFGHTALNESHVFRRRRLMSGSNMSDLNTNETVEAGMLSEQVGARMERVCSTESQVIKLADRPVELRIESFSSQMFRALSDDRSLCLKTIGYFQDTLFFMPHHRQVRSWFDLSKAGPPEGYPGLGNTSIAVHVRSCFPSGMTAWHFLPEEYYATVLTILKKEEPSLEVFIVTTKGCLSSPLVQSLITKFGARSAAPVGKDPTTIDDFRFLLNAPRLLLGKSTFGFWAGFLSPTATQIHMPVELKQAGHQKIPLAYFDSRFVFHHLPDLSFFGTAQSNTIRFNIHTGVKRRRRWRAL